MEHKRTDVGKVIPHCWVRPRNMYEKREMVEANGGYYVHDCEYTEPKA